MNTPRYLIGAVLFPLAWVLPSRAADGDTQVWLDQRVTCEVRKGWDVQVQAQERLEPSSDDAARQFKLTPLIVWHHSPRYDFGTGYKFTQTWREDGTSGEDHEAVLFMTVNWELEGFRISSRQRFDSGFTENEDWMGRARHRVGVEYAGWSESLHLRPFLDNEWFFDLVERDISENRLRGGLKYEFNKMFGIEAYGMRRDQWAPDDTHVETPVAGVALNLTF